jgi:two-component system sensor histidine kinase/response regulator
VTQHDAATDPSGPTRTATVLVVDDNRVVRQGLTKALGTAGYEVETAANGLEALLVTERCSPDAIVCDIMMPVMDGMRFFERLVAVAPTLARRVLFVTAWADDPTFDNFLAQAGRPILHKPFEVPDLLRAVAGIIAGSNGGPTGSESR